MSLAALMWAWGMEDLDPTEKLLLLAIADHHNESTGRCFPSRKTLGRRACVSSETVRRWLRRLEERGLITTVGSFDEEGRQRSNEYVIALDESSLPTRGGHGGVVGEDCGDVVGEEHAGVPPTNRKKELEERTRSGGGRSSAVKTIDERVVESAELELAHGVLEVWNAITGQSLSATSWVRMILRRLGEHPELDLDGHERVMKAALADPWWKGKPSPNVVYGSDAQFERSLLAVEAQAGDKDAVERMRALVARTRRAA